MTSKLLRAALATLFLATPLLQAAIPPAENLLPSDTLAFFSVPDCASPQRAAAAKSSSSWIVLGVTRTMKPFRDMRWWRKWNDQFMAPLEHDLGVRAADFMDLPQGQFTLAVTVAGSTGHNDVPPGMLLLLDAKGKSDSLKTNLAALEKRWSDSGRTLRKETIHGVEFTVVPLASNDFAGILPKKTPVSELGKEPEKPEKPGEIYLAQFETLLIAGNSPKAVEPVAAHLTGGSAPAIADNAVFAADKVSQFRDNPQYIAWFNGKSFFDLVSQTPADSGDEDSPSPLGMSPVKAFGALGLSGMKSITFAMHETHEGSMVTLHVAAPEAERNGVVKILAIPPKDASVPPFVPADAVKFSRMRLDGKQAWAEVQKVISTISPSGPVLLNQAINMANQFGQQKDPGFDIRKDLFGNLNDDIVVYQKAAIVGSSLAELANPPTLYLIAVSNPDATINAVKAIGTMSDPQDSPAEPRDFLGRKIYTIAMRPASGRGASASPQRALYVSASGGYIALSMDSAMVEEFLRSAQGQNKPLRENAGLQSALEHLGGAGAGTFSYEDHRSDARTGLLMLKTQPAALGEGISEITGVPDTVVNALMMNPSMKSFLNGLDYSLLPDYGAISKYFYISAYTGGADAGGLTFKFFNPRPPTLN